MLNSTTFKLPLTNNSIARERKKMHFPLFQRETEQDRQDCHDSRHLDPIIRKWTAQLLHTSPKR
jgi:hypothetical protein